MVIQDFGIPCGNGNRFGNTGKICIDRVLCQSVDIKQKGFQGDCAVYMKDCLLMCLPILQNRLNAVQWATRCVMVRNQSVDLFLHHFQKQGGNIRKMIIKGVPVDVATVYDIFHCNFIDRAFF